MTQRDTDSRCHELTEHIKERAPRFGLRPREIRHAKGWYVDLDCEVGGRVAAQIHCMACRADGRALAIGDAGEDWPDADPFEEIKLGAFNMLSGYFGPNMNWIRGLKNFSQLRPAKAVFVPHELLTEPDGGKLRRHLDCLLGYAARNRCQSGNAGT